MRIKKATIQDIEAILSLNIDLFRFEQAFTDTYSLDWTYSPIGREYFIRRLSHDNGIVFIAEHDGKPIGYICGYIFLSHARNQPLMAEIDNMFVMDHFRQKGIGTLLMDIFLSEVQKRGVRRVKVTALHDNGHAHEFYKKQGFTHHEVVFEKEIT